MSLISSTIFWILLNLWGAIIPILYFSVFITRSSKMADHGAKVWAIGSLWMLKKFCGITHEIRGVENLPDGPCIVACKHQSMWETIVMHLVFNRPVYVYKKELEKIPFYGWYLKIMSGIKLDRKGGVSALKDLIRQSKEAIADGQTIVIFPQGTRVPVGAPVEKYPYQAGIAALYLACDVKVVPAALNSGIFWPKHKMKKYSGKIILEFLPAIEPGLKKDEFNKKMQEAIERKSEELCRKC